MHQNDGSRPIANKGQPAGDTSADALAWKVDGNHVYPVNDLRQHSVTECWCRPIDDEGVVVHHSLDGREQYERGDRKPS